MFSQENTPVRVGVLDLLYKSQGSQYVIPAYQRNYTWTAGKEVRQLLDDLKEVLKGNYKQHFIGIMIYLERSLNPFVRERSIIDGQQRLTTVFLTLYAIKHLMAERGMAAEAKQLEDYYLVNLTNQDIKYKLKPLVSDDTVYKQIVSEDFDSITAKDSNVYKNYIYIKEQLAELSNRYTLTQLIEAINKLYMVCVPVTEEDYPQRIFESINATGAKLTASDLIRNFILMPIPSDTQDVYYTKYWKKLETLVSDDAKKLEAYFRFFIMAKNLTVVNKNAVYYAFTNWYKTNEPDLGVEGVFQEVVNYAAYYNAIYVRNVDELEADIQKPVKEFRAILSDMPAPLLMEFYSLHSKKDTNGKPLLSAEAFGQIVTILNAYLMRRALAGMDTSDISRYFPTLLKDVLTDCDGNYDNVVEIFKKNLVNRNRGNSQQMPDDKTLRDRIINANMYNLRTWLQIFFRKLESQDNPAPVDFSKLSIEHLMPQTPTADWYATLGVEKETYERNVHRLGNLALAAKPDNSKMGNKPWEYKNKILSSTSHLKMNQAVLARGQWTISDIEERTEELIGSMASLYPYYESKTEDVTGYPIQINLGSAFAIATYYPDNGSVEVAKGSTLLAAVKPELYVDIEQMRQDMLEEGVIDYNADGILEFVDSFVFYPKRTGTTALSTSASFILHGNRNGWEYWTTEDGTPIKDSPLAADKLN